MRKVVLRVAISLDGYIARKNGSVDFLSSVEQPGAEDPELMRSLTEYFRSVDTAVMGRKTLDVALAMTGGKFDGHGLASYVLSRVEKPGERDGYTYTNQSPTDLIVGLRSRAGKDIWLMGGGETAREFLSADLVDEIHLDIVPVLLGDGLPLFPAGFPQREFACVENDRYANGMVSLQYRRERG